MDEYTPSQASVVTGLPLSAVHKAIDTHLIRPRRTPRTRKAQRVLSLAQLLYLQLEAKGVQLLPLTTRRKIAQAVQATPELDVIAATEGGVLLIDCKAARHQVQKQVQRLEEARQIAVSDPEIFQGAPVYCGTRIPVALIADMLTQGATVEEILEGYPALNRSQVELASLYVKAFPRRGRPPLRPWANAGARHQKAHAKR